MKNVNADTKERAARDTTMTVRMRTREIACQTQFDGDHIFVNCHASMFPL